MSEPIVGIAIFIAKPGRAEDVGRLLTAVVEPTRAEGTALYYDLYQDRAEPRRWVFIESWKSEEALQSHLRTPHLLALLEVLPELIEHSEVDFLNKVR